MIPHWTWEEDRQWEIREKEAITIAEDKRLYNKRLHSQSESQNDSAGKISDVTTFVADLLQKYDLKRVLEQFSMTSILTSILSVIKVISIFIPCLVLWVMCKNNQEHMLLLTLIWISKEIDIGYTSCKRDKYISSLTHGWHVNNNNCIQHFTLNCFYSCWY